jgi:methylthioribose-1-phosphate isomerase
VEIPIEERASEEIAKVNGAMICREGSTFFNPGFDVTPFQYIDGIITEKGVVRPQRGESLARLFS